MEVYVVLCEGYPDSIFYSEYMALSYITEYLVNVRNEKPEDIKIFKGFEQKLAYKEVAIIG